MNVLTLLGYQPLLFKIVLVIGAISFVKEIIFFLIGNKKTSILVAYFSIDTINYSLNKYSNRNSCRSTNTVVATKSDDTMVEMKTNCTMLE